MKTLITLTLAAGLMIGLNGSALADGCGGATKATTTAASVKVEAQNIVKTAQSAGSFTTLL